MKKMGGYTAIRRWKRIPIRRWPHGHARATAHPPSRIWGTDGRTALKINVWLGGHQLYVLHRMRDVLTSAHGTVHTFKYIHSLPLVHRPQGALLAFLLFTGDFSRRYLTVTACVICNNNNSAPSTHTPTHTPSHKLQCWQVENELNHRDKSMCVAVGYRFVSPWSSRVEWR